MGGERERERERERHLCERETSIGCLSHAPQPEIEPTTQACAPIETQTCDLSVYRAMIQQTEPQPVRAGYFYLINYLNSSKKERMNYLD